jgi:MFS family permease
MEKEPLATLGGKSARYALLLIALSQAMSMVDRQILAILMPRIKTDLQIGDAEMGLLYGTVFALFYAVFSLPLGRLADGWIRTKQLGLSILGWSAMTAMGGMANSYGVLALSRLGVGIGEASVQPAGFSLLSDVFPKEKRGTVTAVIAASVALGLGSALWLGGAVADGWDNAYTTANAPFGIKGWQVAFIVASLPGLLLGVLLLRMKEPQRGLADGIVHIQDPHPIRESWLTLTSILPGLAWVSLARLHASAREWLLNIGGMATLICIAVGLTWWTNTLTSNEGSTLAIGSLTISGNALQWMMVTFGAYVVLSWLQSLKLRDLPTFTVIAKCPSMILLMVIACLQTMINYSVMAWTPSYLINFFQQKPAEVGLTFGALIAGLGIVGPMIAGPISDWVNQRVKGGRLYVTLFSLVASTVLAFITFTSKTIGQFYLFFCAYSLVLTMWLPAVYATMLDLVLPRMRGTVISFYILTTTIFGLGLGPYIVGLMSDLNGGNLSVAILNVYWVSPILIVSVILLIRKLSIDEELLLPRARISGEAV